MTQYPVIDKSLIAPELWERYKLTKDYIVDKKNIRHKLRTSSNQRGGRIWACSSYQKLSGNS